MIVLFVGLALLVAFCAPRKAQAFVPTPSPELDVPEQVGRAVALNAIGIIGAALIVLALIVVSVRSMRKHEN